MFNLLFYRRILNLISVVVTKPNHVLNQIFAGYLATMQLLQPIVFS